MSHENLSYRPGRRNDIRCYRSADSRAARHVSQSRR
jgi:hypothetical protein